MNLRQTNYATKGYKKQRDKQIIFAYLADYKVNKYLCAYQYSSSLKNELLANYKHITQLLPEIDKCILQ